MFGVLGIAVVTAPILIYYVYKGALSSLIEQCFMFNTDYINALHTVELSTKKYMKNALLIFGVPAASLIIAFLLKFNTLSILSLALAFSNSAMLLLTVTNYTHYFVPQTVIIFVILLTVSLLDKNFKKLCYIGLLICSLSLAGYELINSYMVFEKVHTDYWNQTVSTIKAFKENTEKIFIDDDKCNDIFYVEDGGAVDNASRYF